MFLDEFRPAETLFGATRLKYGLKKFQSFGPSGLTHLPFTSICYSNGRDVTEFPFIGTVVPVYRKVFAYFGVPQLPILYFSYV